MESWRSDINVLGHNVLQYLFDRYEGEFKTTKSLREGPEILLGAELGNRFKYRHQMEEYIRYFDWDFLVGSAHAIDGFGIASKRGLGYFEAKSEQESPMGAILTGSRSS